MQVNDVSVPEVRKLGVNALPAVVGWLSNGEKQILKAGISVKDLESAVQELVTLLESFEKKNKIVSNQAKKSQSESSTNQVPLLTASNFGDLCGEGTPVCLIGGFRSSKARNKLESILSMVSLILLIVYYFVVKMSSYWKQVILGFSHLLIILLFLYKINLVWYRGKPL